MLLVYRQLNSPKEMGRRMCFLVYIVCWLVFCIEVMVTMARPGLPDLTVTAGAMVGMTALRYIGFRWLDFGRMFESFPEGCVLDTIPEPVREEVEQLVFEFHAPGTDWVRRNEIRHRLIELEEQQPEIIEAYGSDLKQVLAA